MSDVSAGIGTGMGTTLWRDAPVPPAYWGLWRRLSIIEPDGQEDHDTRVLWLQTPTHHVDVRVPADRPDFPRATGADAGAWAEAQDLDALLTLARQEGFAGTNVWSEGRLAWRRSLDFARPDGPPDEGMMRPGGPDRMTEVGLHRGYREEWERLDGADGPFAVEVRPGRLHLRAGRWVALAEERRTPPPPGRLRALAAVAAAGGDREALQALLDCPISFATIGEDGRALVRLSTHPWLEGTEIPIPSGTTVEKG